MKYIFVGAQMEHLESGRPLAFGDAVEITDGTDQRLIDLGLLVSVQTPPSNPKVKETDADAAGS